MERMFIVLGAIIGVMVVLAVYLGYLMGATVVQRTVSPSSSPLPASASISSTTGYERIDITAAYVSNATYVVNGSTYYEVTVEVVNKGATRVTIDKIFVDNVEVPRNGTTIYWVIDRESLGPGEGAKICVYLDHDNHSSGQVIQIIIRTDMGRKYPTQVVLP